MDHPADIARPYLVSGITLYPGVICGFSRYPDEQSEIEHLLR
ncbi:hypothetical protein [[Clostridium] symbiosum]|uniref:Uncharacterized protein n=1 Tax=[Clostridium] symbiosum ATCC 14940 TaxID=411472 RepID=A0ABC9TT42_CLOSY|nr:hypothetical protein [[Clostridium] symbiosum]ERI74318.1 hypothetical protein CLOSYM_04078 [[Clostridium] symbiosum ATCC 14940]MDM8136610.1 hypothetical protein [[Clostridium] symbiosum]MDM8140828.1 hypothetical protein [[Clostridium] symbiosum]MDM8320791.1 hypothetical protein [[Clostridium] symbiosum]